MSSQYSRVRIAMDLFNEAPRFAPFGQTGDRFERFISFEGDLPVPIPEFKTAPRVIITPVRKLARDGTMFNLMTPVCAARDVTPKGFRVSACNQDPDFGGTSAFDWIAIEESPEQVRPVPNVATGVLAPLHFAGFRESFRGQRTFHDHEFGPSGIFDASSTSVQLTSADSQVQGRSVAAVGIVDSPQDQQPRLDMTAHNVDVTPGSCAFNWVKFSRTELFDAASANGAEPLIDTGGVSEAWFEPGGQTGDWRIRDVVFKARFLKPPVVLLTATQASDVPSRLSAAVVPVVQAVTTDGFRLAARSCDSRPGLSGFNWIAIGQGTL